MPNKIDAGGGVFDDVLIGGCHVRVVTPYITNRNTSVNVPMYSGGGYYSFRDNIIINGIAHGYDSVYNVSLFTTSPTYNGNLFSSEFSSMLTSKRIIDAASTVIADDYIGVVIHVVSGAYVWIEYTSGVSGWSG